MDEIVSLELAEVRFGGEGIPVRVEGADGWEWEGKGGGRDRSEYLPEVEDPTEEEEFERPKFEEGNREVGVGGTEDFFEFDWEEEEERDREGRCRELFEGI